VTHCARCGEPDDTGDHVDCQERLELEPPRFCPQCGRRMVVQVTPLRWVANCSVHGQLAP